MTDTGGRLRSLAGVMALSAIFAGASAPSAAMADDRWNPFAERDAARERNRTKPAPVAADARPLLPPVGGQFSTNPVERPPANFPSADASAGVSPPGTYGAPISSSPQSASASAGIVRGELAPVVASDGSGLPHGLWQGIEAGRFERLLAKLDIPPRSPALHALWRRLITASVEPGQTGAQQFRALKAEALYRSGLIEDSAKQLEAASEAHPVLGVLSARADIARRKNDSGCEAIKTVIPKKADLPTPLRADALLIAGYCAAVNDNVAGAGLMADLAREDGVDAPLGLAALDALASGQKAKLTIPKRVTAIDYRLLERLGPLDPTQIVERAEPSLLAAIAQDAGSDAKLRLAAAEAGSRLNVVDATQLAAIYRSQAFAPDVLADPLNTRTDPLQRRALLFKAAEAERTPQKKARVIRALLDDARRSGIYLQTLALVTKVADDVPRAQEVGWFAETGIEIALANGRYDAARSWVAFTAGMDRGQYAGEQGPLGHWLALIDIADAELKSQRGASLASVEALALRGRYTPDLLHRLATVLDALDYNVPHALWEAASRTPQPTTGHLPETGVLPELLDASKKKSFGLTVLLAMRTLGPTGADGAHMIALGDAIRALKRTGLEADARRIAVEALFAGWPRAVSQ